MVDVRVILEFFAQMAPQMGVNKDMLDNVKTGGGQRPDYQADVLLMYYLICDQIFEFHSMPEIKSEDPFARAKIITRIYECV